jgi:hypothetical protein
MLASLVGIGVAITVGTIVFQTMRESIGSINSANVTDPGLQQVSNILTGFPTWIILIIGIVPIFIFTKMFGIFSREDY